MLAGKKKTHAVSYTGQLLSESIYTGKKIQL